MKLASFAGAMMIASIFAMVVTNPEGGWVIVYYLIAMASMGVMLSSIQDYIDKKTGE